MKFGSLLFASLALSVGLGTLHCSSAGSALSSFPSEASPSEEEGVETPEPEEPEEDGGTSRKDAGARRDASKDAASEAKPEPPPEPPPLACGLLGQVECGGACVDVNDTAHCGGCFQSCTAPTNGTVVCVQGTCSPRCPLGQALVGTACQPVAAGSVTPMMALGSDHSCGLTNQGAVRCWGMNVNAQLGNGTMSSFGSGATDKVPGDVVGLGGGVSFIASGSVFSCAITNTGAVRCWGDNDRGSLGIGKVTLPRATPLDDVIGLGGTPTALSLGSGHACALVGGAVKCWGRNLETQLGDSTSVDRTSPIQVAGLSGVVDVRSGSTFTCALAGGAVKCWGKNVQGLGNGATSSLTPATITGLSSGVVAVRTGYSHACALLSSGAVRCWGNNIYGQLGDGTKTDRAAPVDVVGLSGGIAELVVGGNFSCVRTAAGAALCWGKNVEGTLGDGTTVNRTTATPVSGLTGVTRLFAGGAHACAFANGVRCWGRNYYGQIGDGTNVNRTSPVLVSY